MHTTEKNYIDRCKALVEAKLNWKDSQDWKQRDYEYLCELIFEETKILLSLSTVKRLWNKNYEGTPHQSTLNALAIYVGFKNWLDFKKNQFEVINQESSQTNKIKQELAQTSERKSKLLSKVAKRDSLIYRYRVIFIILICIAGGSLFFFTALHPFKSPINYDDVTFTSKKVVTSGLPNTVIFNYDISTIKSDSVFIQQSWNTKRRALISKENEHHSSVYYYPGFHKAKLIVDNEIIKQHNIHVTTDGWLGIVRYTLNQATPFYIPQQDIIHKGILYASPLTLQTNNVDLSKKDYFVSYFNVQDFGNLEGDNFIIETQIRNDSNERGLLGQYSGLTIMCENGRIVIPLTIPGLVGNLSVKFIERWVHGTENDLSAFGCDITRWNELKCEVTNRIAQISLNDKWIYEVSFTQPAGRIIGLHFMFYGCGEVNFVKLYDVNEHVVFEDNFVE